MSQTTTEQTADSDQIEQVVETIESLTEDGAENLSDEKLVKLHTALRSIEGSAEEARKSVVESVLRDRVEPGETLLGLSRVESHSKYVAEDSGTVIMRAVSEGIDYTEFTEIKASKLAKVAPDLAEIGRSEYDYFR